MTVAAADTALPERTTAAAAAGGLHSSPGHQAPYTTPEALDAHVERAWAHFRGLGSPKWHVAPMVDQVGAGQRGAAKPPTRDCSELLLYP